MVCLLIRCSHNSISTDSGRNRWGIDAMALDPNNPNKVYTAVGMYTSNW